MMVANGFSSEKIEIKRMESSTAHRTLGYFISPEGNYDVQINNLVEMAQQWSTKIQLSNLTGYQIVKAYQSVLLPQIQYRLAASSLSYQQCDRLNVIANPIILHAYGIQKHFPRSILEAGNQYAGLQMYHFYDVHGITKFKFFKHHLSINDYTGQLLLISMHFTQLE